MRAAATTDKLRRAYRLSLVHEELKQVVFYAARACGAREPTRAPRKPPAAWSVRTWTRLCAPERAMSRAESRRVRAEGLRARVAAEAPEIRRAVRARGEQAPRGRPVVGERYAARAQREQSDSAALAAYLEDEGSRRGSEAAAASLDPFAAALRWGFEAAAAREAEMRADGEAALTDMIDAEVAAAHSEYAGADPTDTRREHGSLGTTSRLSRDARKKRLTREDWREDRARRRRRAEHGG